MKRRFLALVSAVLAIVMIAGCGGTSTSKPAEQKPAEQKPAEPPKPKVLTVVSGTDIQSLDIHKVSDSPSFTVLEHVNETLFTMTPSGEIKPLLAETFTLSPDGKVATVKLRSGVKFSDGSAFNAAAVKKNLDRVMDKKFGAAFGFLLGLVKEVRVKDELTVEIETTSPFGPLQFHLTHGGTAIIAPSAIDKGPEAMAAGTIGTGPYTIKEWKKGEAVTLSKNANYWGEKAKIDTLVFKMVKEDGPRVVEVESGAADIAKGVPPSEIARLKSNPNLNIEITPGLRTIYMYFNVSKAPFNNPKVRQAFNYAVDKDAIVKSILNDMGRVSDAPFAPNIFGYAPQTVYKADKAKARQLLAEAGFASGLKVELLHPTGRYPQDARIAEAVRQQLKEVGVDVTLKTMEWAQYIPHIRKPMAENTVQIGMLGWSTPTMDADYAMFSLLHSSSFAPGFNLGFYKNEKVDKALMAARSTGDNAKRKQLYAEAVKEVWNDAPWLFLHSEIQVTAMRKNVSGFLVHPSERFIATGADKK